MPAIAKKVLPGSPKLPHPVLDRTARLRAKADALGLDCLDTQWMGRQSKHRFLCSMGHEFTASPMHLAKGFSKCPVCRGHEFMGRLLRNAQAAQVECLDTEWRGHQGLYRFRCRQGHRWKQSSRNPSCPICSRDLNRQVRRLADGLARLQQLCKDRGGMCLSGTYLGSAQRHRFSCAQGHVWDTSASEVLRGAWCGACSNERKRIENLLPDGLARLQRAAQAKGGLCLSEDYTGSNQQYRFRCAAGHEWTTLGARALRGVWCLTCAHAAASERLLRPDGLDQLRALATAKGGVCLSLVYAGVAGRHRFRCSQGHEWETSAAVALKGGWCGQCQRDGRRLGIEAARAAAKARGGQCLTQHYTNTATRMTWLCDRGHVWQTAFSVIRAGKWCPQCAHMARISNRTSKARAKYEVNGSLEGLDTSSWSAGTTTVPSQVRASARINAGRR